MIDTICANRQRQLQQIIFKFISNVEATWQGWIKHKEDQTFEFFVCFTFLEMLQHFQGWVITETPNWDTGSKIKSRDTQQSGRKHDREKDLKPLLTIIWPTHQLMFSSLWATDNNNARSLALELSLSLKILLVILLWFSTLIFPSQLLFAFSNFVCELRYHPEVSFSPHQAGTH